jgi:acetoin utilization deacetylase AcuC-like enzyme
MPANPENQSTMQLAVFTQPSGLEHDTGPSHPERIARLQTVVGVLDEPVFRDLPRLAAQPASVEQLQRVHDAEYVEWLLSHIPASGLHRIDGDTVICPASGRAALDAAGAAVAAVDAVMTGSAVKRAFCAVRPPGHHAEPGDAMGFCLFNNIAVGAAHALAAHGCERVAIVDFDVHHGNGTQSMAEREGRFLYISLHEYPLFPGTGAPQETGKDGNVLNAIMRPGSGRDEYRHAFETSVVPKLKSAQPDLLMISAGFDAHRLDPLASIELDDEDFGWMTRELVAIADEYCGGRVISMLEGGYDLDGLAGGLRAHLQALMVF